MLEYNLQCSCGANFKIVLTTSALYQVYCYRCEKWLYHNPRMTTATSQVKEKKPRQTSATPLSKSSIDRYQVLQKLSEGSFGKVYLAFDPEEQEKVAIKILQLDQLSKPESNNIVKYFIREAQILMAMNHVGIWLVNKFLAAKMWIITRIFTH